MLSFLPNRGLITLCPLFLGWAWGSSLFFSSPAFGQDNDLEIVPGSIAVSQPFQPDCRVQLSASFLINGNLDHLLSSGQTAIRFWYHATTPPPQFPNGWAIIPGVIPATFIPSDVPFQAGNTWPDNFASAQGASLTWELPANLPQTFSILAQAIYFSGEDDVTTNNETSRTVSREPCIPIGCWLFFFPSFGWVAACPPPHVIDTPNIMLRCARNSDCAPIVVRPAICDVVKCPPCMAKGACPPTDEFELLVGIQSKSDLEVALFADSGEEIARAVPFSKSCIFKRRKYTHILRFDADTGVSSFLQVLPGERTARDETHGLRFQLRQKKLKGR